MLGQQFDRDARAGLLPRLGQELFLKPRETPLRGSHQILHRRVAAAHFRQHRFGGDAAIHHPDTPRAAVLLLDLGQEHPQRLAHGLSRYCNVRRRPRRADHSASTQAKVGSMPCSSTFAMIAA